MAAATGKMNTGSSAPMTLKRRLKPGAGQITVTCRPVPVPKYGFYVYGSSPPNAFRPMYRHNIERPRGAHDYYNMMWDPHVYRGETYITFQEIEAQRRKEISGAKDRKRRWKKLPPRRLGGIVMPTTPGRAHNTSLVTDLSRFLEEEPRVVEEVDAITQTDAFNCPKVKTLLVPAKIGFDVSTQILPDELFHFDEEVTPLVENLVLKVMEQSLLENCEEEELIILKEEQSYYNDRRRLEQLRLKRLAHRERIAACERERRMRQSVVDRTNEEDLQDMVGARMFAKSYLKLMIPHLYDTLENDGLLQNFKTAAVTEEFVPWLNDVVKAEISERLLADAMVDDLLETVIETREAESLATNIWNQLPSAPDVSEEEDGEGNDYYGPRLQDE